MRIYLVLSVSIIILLLSLIEESIAQTINKTPAELQNKKEELCIYSERQIDFNAVSLPAKYHGNNLLSITLNVLNADNLIKDEFETTQQFFSRLETERKKFLDGELGYNSVLAFETNEVGFRYDADKGAMKGILTIRNLNIWSAPCLDFTSKNSSILSSTEQTDKKISELEVRQKDFSFRSKFENPTAIIIDDLIDLLRIHKKHLIVQDKKTNKTQLQLSDILIPPPSRLPVAEKLHFFVYLVDQNEWFFRTLSFNIEVEKAKRTKPNLRTLFIGSVLDQNDKSYKRGGFNLLLKEIWIYDVVTGEIFLKQKVGSEKKPIIIEDKKTESVEIGALVSYATRQSTPDYPKSAKSLGITGTVLLNIVIDELGNVAEIINVSGPAMLQSAAKDAIMKWKFKPFSKNGEAVKATGYISFKFAL